jgi:hypothetical protein
VSVRRLPDNLVDTHRRYYWSTSRCVMPDNLCQPPDIVDPNG